VITAREVREGEFSLNGHLEDEDHVMDVQLVIHSKTREVLSAYACMGKVPYGSLCRRAASQVSSLVGLRVEPGCYRQVFRLLGGEEGCTHLAELSLDALRAFLPAWARKERETLTRALQGQGLSPAQVDERVSRHFMELGRALLPGTCVVYARGDGSPPGVKGGSEE
jgi:hypothetical protein